MILPFRDINSVFLTSLILLSLSILSGCQSLGTWFSANSESVPPPLAQAQVHTIANHEFDLTSKQQLVGQLATVATRETDTLSDIARHYGLGYNDMVIANRSIRPWTPEPGSQTLLPLAFILPDTPHEDIVLNLASMRLFYYPPQKPQKVFTYPVGIGRQGWSSPTGLTRIVAKQPNPVWHVPPSIQQEHAAKGDPLPAVVRSGPENPLGYYAMRLGFPGYLIHGTNKPYGIGMQISHGCIQMYPEDVEKLFAKVKVGTKVRIVHQPYLAAWHGDRIYLEAHKPLGKWQSSEPMLQKNTIKKLKAIAKDKKAEIDWHRVEDVLRNADGIPVPVTVNSPNQDALVAQAQPMQHPERLYGQPQVTDLKDSDWSMRVATYKTEAEAAQLAAMLNHQGPQIQARPVKVADEYQVIAGPYKNRKAVAKDAKRVLIDFELKAKALKPGPTS